MVSQKKERYVEECVALRKETKEVGQFYARLKTEKEEFEQVYGRLKAKEEHIEHASA